MNELFRIVNGALRLDVDKVRNYTAFLADKLEKEGDQNLAIRLRELLKESDHQLRPTEVSYHKTIPVDSESRFPLLEHVNLKTLRDPPLLLAQNQWDVINEFLSVAKSYAHIEAHDVVGSLSFLMYGPPGTGKSRLARHIAVELGLDLYVARLDGIISSYLGSTAKNIRALFDFAAKTPCVLFLDEFDAIAKLRGDSQELGELKRVVNSFLQNLDTLGKQSIVIAATNHQTLLDNAVWRRFSYRVELRLPEPEIRKKMWSAFLVPLHFEDRDIELLSDLSEGFSGSDIYEATLRLRRRNITAKEKPGLKDAFEIIQNLSIGNDEETRFVSKLTKFGIEKSIQLLRERNPKIYSLAALADLFGLSKTSIHRFTTKEGEKNG
ncbi:MAG TPA: ATP-binding protein [Candidatus Acidoferrum sp.]|nr:ATP-binding protein [Candidatus Acidoferrum sp.]